MRRPKAQEMLRIPGSVDKQQLHDTVEFHGAANLADFNGYAAGVLRFGCFVGTWDKTAKRFTGEFIFSISINDPEVRKANYNDIPGIAPATSGKGKK